MHHRAGNVVVVTDHLVLLQNPVGLLVVRGAVLSRQTNAVGELKLVEGGPLPIGQCLTGVVLLREACKREDRRHVHDLALILLATSQLGKHVAVHRK